ncbi:translocon-associated protein, alpha subunit [Pilobolus umbonatus]|nr:translocon-associated protein, alpha subunit [Pilobolus umbonatus]
MKFSSILTLGLLVIAPWVYAQETTVPTNIEITAQFPDNPFGLITNGKKNNVILDLANKEDKAYNVYAISGRVTKLDDHSTIIRNLTTTRYNTPLDAKANVRVPYSFYSEFKAGDYGLTVFVDLESNGNGLRFVGYNGTMTVTEPEGTWFDPQLIVLYIVLLAGAVGLYYIVRSALSPEVTKTKKVKKVEEPTERPAHRDEKGEMVLDESWIPEHHMKLQASSSSKKQSPKAKKRSKK